ncbi:MAG: class II fructose-bisphosphate aldolase [Dehalococcoidales bacterium]|nr:MAG: class II fructose-bisphosphate aldolase [Dehalococcoidales bacterium]
MAIDKIDGMIEKAVFSPVAEDKESGRKEIRGLASSQGIYLASIQGLYEAAARGEYSNKTVPAINVRGITYQVARTIFKTAQKLKAGAFIFEIARTEMVYTDQPPQEYVISILAAAIKEGYTGPVFVQGDHFQFNKKKYDASPEDEMNILKNGTRDAVSAGFLNIDIDSSTLVVLDRPTLDEQQKDNYTVAANMTQYIRGMEPEGVTISVGGEIGEVGKTNTTVEELRAYMDGYNKLVGKDTKGISKISVQTGTTHGGLVLPDGSIADVKLDFNTIKELGKVAREEYGVGGIVQHGASTLPDDMFDLFPEANTLEVHLATGYQNTIYDSAHFPKDLLNKMHSYITQRYGDEKKDEDTQEQFIYKTRKKGWGGIKEETWHLPEVNMSGIMQELEDQFTMVFKSLNAVDTVDLVSKYISKP